MQEINDELMMPCAQCCRKHLSAAIAYLALCSGRRPYIGGGSMDPDFSAHVAAARAAVNLAEARSGYVSHRSLAIGYLVMGEEDFSVSARMRSALRSCRLDLSAGADVDVLGRMFSTPEGGTAQDYADNLHYAMYSAHLTEAYREYPEVRDALCEHDFHRDNMSHEEHNQAIVNFHLAQLKWLDENVFGQRPVEKGEDKMATKRAAKPAAKAAAKKCACKGGNCKK